MEERMKILEMLEAKTITAEEASELLSTLDKQKVQTNIGGSSSTIRSDELLKKDSAKTLYIKVLSEDGDKVNINIPIAFLKAAIKSGTINNLMNKSIKVNGNNVMEDIDLDLIIASIEAGNVGKIVEIESADGDCVDIYIE